MNIELELYRAATGLIVDRYSAGWGGAAALRTASGRILTRVAPDTKNDALALCMKTGGCLEAHKFNEAVTHSLCIYRESANAPFIILSPCGVCQERLMYCGNDVRVAISNPVNQLVFKALGELQPYHWPIVNSQ